MKREPRWTLSGPLDLVPSSLSPEPTPKCPPDTGHPVARRGLPCLAPVGFVGGTQAWG